MSNIESSIIIPVFNHWKLTHACLESLASTLKGEHVEVIVVDNASSDETPNECPLLGKRLFGSSFHYHRCPQNINFGPASNFGAKMAKGEFLVFLNNDTVALPGWYRPLIQDFTTWPNIAATGPLLLYPKDDVLGYTVQHLGVFISPFSTVGHLYEYIPEASLLTKKRRFFQVITAACMFIRRSLFMDIGMFDEYFQNGFEDVDLCARLSLAGYRMTVNPEAKVIHYQGQTPGRHSFEDKNSDYLIKKSLRFLKPDYPFLVKNDKLSIEVEVWGKMKIIFPQEQTKKLKRLSSHLPYEELKQLVFAYPYWKEGWEHLINKSNNSIEKFKLSEALSKIFPEPNIFLSLLEQSKEQKNNEKLVFYLSRILPFCDILPTIDQKNLDHIKTLGFTELAEQISYLQNNIDQAKSTYYNPFIKNLSKFLSKNKFFLSLNDLSFYKFWLASAYLNRQENKKEKEYFISSSLASFSLFLPLTSYNTKSLSGTLDSIINQTYPHWELYITNNKPISKNVYSTLEQYAQKDSRIKVKIESECNNILTNNFALEKAKNKYLSLLTQGDTLSHDALYVMAKAIEKKPEGLLFYSDEDYCSDKDYCDAENSYQEPYLKSDRWDQDLILFQNFVSHLGVYNIERVRKIGGFREELKHDQEYDMMLRYITGADFSQFIHVPHILYHSHKKKTEKITENTLKALQEYVQLNSLHSEKSTPSEIFNGRIKFSLPTPLPLISILYDISEKNFDIRNLITNFLKNTTYEQIEILLVDTDKKATDIQKIKIEDYPNVHIVYCPTSYSHIERLNMSSQHACGKILGFLSNSVFPATKEWAEEIVSSICREGVGVTGGKLVYQNGYLFHAGYMVDGTNKLVPILSSIHENKNIWNNWTNIPRTVDALDSQCFFTYSDIFKEIGMFDTSLPNAFVQDYCLRIHRNKGLRTVWWPFAKFIQQENIKINTDHAFQQRWANRIEPFNRHLIAVKEDAWLINTTLLEEQQQ